jgi:hypothetical protein
MICDFLEPFYDITKGTQWDDSILVPDEVLSNMDFLVAHYDETNVQYTEQGSIRMVNRLFVVGTSLTTIISLRMTLRSVRM